MPAARSRTEHWSDSLRKIHERGGAIEISVRREGATNEPGGSDVVWRVKVLAVSTTEILIEPPAAFGASLDLREGLELVGGMTVGQNRWMFHTSTKGYKSVRGPDGHTWRAVVLSAPTGVERCIRRAFHRISTADLRLPPVQCWPLLNPSSVVTAEAANRLHIERLMLNPGTAQQIDDEPKPDSLHLPEVGPAFRAALVNVSGGGLGLLINRDDAAAIDRKHHFWMRIDLRPEIPAPVAVTARLAHTHLDSEQNVHAGLAFEFAFNPTHRKFVVDLFSAYVNRLMTRQRLAA